jgi:hypothetical protein
MMNYDRNSDNNMQVRLFGVRGDWVTSIKSGVLLNSRHEQTDPVCECDTAKRDWPYNNRRVGNKR